MSAPAVRAVLFDLDGTFVDSAPDMARVLNAMRRERGHADLPLAAVRPHVNRGARGMVAVGFSLTAEDAGYLPLRDEFYRRYEADVFQDSTWMPGIRALVESLELRGTLWGIVTNKASRFAHPLAAALGISPNNDCLVCGDTTPHTKPHPAPLLHAARLLELDACECAYLGDDRRDIEAARAAGMHPLAAAYGYVADGDDPRDWGAAALIAHPLDLLDVLHMTPR